MKVPELETSMFIVPGQYVKNGDERLIVLNRIALSIVDAQRGKHSSNVFSYRGKPVLRMLNSAWLRALRKIGLPQVRVHDLKHLVAQIAERSTTARNSFSQISRRATIESLRLPCA